MIISQKVSINLGQNNTSYYEELGYLIPKTFSYGAMRVKRNTKIEVKISDLPKNSTTKVLCECCVCKKQKQIKYYCISKKGFYRCKSCSNKDEIKKLSNTQFGKDNPNYNHNVSDKERKWNRCRSLTKGLTPWRKQVLKRDNHTCQCCGSKEHLQAHHINGWIKFPKQRTDIDNGITLCKSCHKNLHSKFGQYTTKENLISFLNEPFHP